MSEKLRLKNEDEYATYEEYNDIMDISMSLSNENQSLQSQLDIANKKLDRVKEYFDKDVKQELKYLYQKSDDFHEGKDYGDLGYGGAIQSVQAISDNILSIIGDE